MFRFVGFDFVTEGFPFTMHQIHMNTAAVISQAQGVCATRSIYKAHITPRI